MPVSLDTLKRSSQRHELRSQRQGDEADRKRDKLVRMGVRPPDYGRPRGGRGLSCTDGAVRRRFLNTILDQTTWMNDGRGEAAGARVSKASG